MTVATSRRTTSGAGPTSPVAELSAAVEVVASFVHAFDPGLYSGADAEHLVTVFTRAERLGGAGKTLAANRAAVCNRHVLTGHRSPAEWLAARTGESVGTPSACCAWARTWWTSPGWTRPYGRGGSLPPGPSWSPPRSSRTPPVRTTSSGVHSTTT